MNYLFFVLVHLKWKSLSGDRHFYLYARKCNIRSEVDGMTREKQLLNLFCIVYINVEQDWFVQATVPSKMTSVVFKPAMQFF